MRPRMGRRVANHPVSAGLKFIHRKIKDEHGDNVSIIEMVSLGHVVMPDNGSTSRLVLLLLLGKVTAEEVVFN